VTIFTGIFGAISSLAAAALQPPPPVLVPPEYDRTIDGYVIGRFYQNWVFWVQAQKGAALDAMLGTPDEIAGENVRGQPILRYSWNDDFGPYLAGDIHSYCRFDDRYRLVAGSCHYRLRQVANDHHTDEPGDPLTLWVRQSFDPEALARRLRALNWVPGAPFYGADQDRAFATLPSPIPVLTQGSTLATVDSRTCPAMARALAALDQRRVDWRTDMTEVGEDGRSQELGVHGVWAVYRLTIRVPGGEVTLDGAGNALHFLAGPVVRAARACIEARAEGTGRRQ
jgi:hypothetical protein